ncbi:hypothetical protein [Janthinobacterium sp.]|uniref:hypothetical protein n=1 Tax=Janthinobacterium sp. TaxID=1871054 RepID=UPI0025BC7627|nr:hypothetical protein [Janthinobacterium sp.]NBV15778.1 hypothetical protein [Janthinobacterium sp.]
MDDMYKFAMAAVLFVLAVILYNCYIFAKANGVETSIVFQTALAIIGVSGLAIGVVSLIGLTEGFCFWLVFCWISLCPLLSAIAYVNSVSSHWRLSAQETVYYGMWWFQWGIGAAFVVLGYFLIKRKRSYY